MKFNQESRVELARYQVGAATCLSSNRFLNAQFIFSSSCNRLKIRKSVDYFCSQKDQSFLMVETTAYFEAYQYVLQGLKELQEDNLPFQR